ncbi:MAG: FHA domain-containing protein [Anaerolineae bacterium]|jgi:hypothetical protein|nr:FHA domain-containing protein [Anaerolineae bacterium]
MNDKHFAQLESHLERLVEGMFAGLFRSQLSAHDIAMKLARAMESHLRVARDDDPRPIAPNRYIITLNSELYKTLQKHRPDMGPVLAQHLIDLAAQAGYRMRQVPLLTFLPATTQPAGEVIVHAEHSDDAAQGTAAMQPIQPATPADRPLNPCLVINGERSAPLTGSIVNVGRSPENHIAIDDPYMSRHHVQIRLREGTHILFDASSKGGTRVNTVVVSEHRLQPGDVIEIGRTRLVYMVDDGGQGSRPAFTDGYTQDPRDAR